MSSKKIQNAKKLSLNIHIMEPILDEENQESPAQHLKTMNDTTKADQVLNQQPEEIEQVLEDDSD